MAGGPLGFKTTPVTQNRVFGNIHTGKGANGHRFPGMGVEGSLGGDAVWMLESDRVPSPLPSGTLTLVLTVRADATSGDAKVNPSWAAGAADVDFSGLTLSAEGTSTVTWTAGDNDKTKEIKVVLNAATAPAAGERVVLHLTFETTGWTLATVSTWSAELIWE